MNIYIYIYKTLLERENRNGKRNEYSYITRKDNKYFINAKYCILHDYMYKFNEHKIFSTSISELAKSIFNIFLYWRL